MHVENEGTKKDGNEKELDQAHRKSDHSRQFLFKKSAHDLDLLIHSGTGQGCRVVGTS